MQRDDGDLVASLRVGPAPDVVGAVGVHVGDRDEGEHVDVVARVLAWRTRGVSVTTQGAAPPNSTRAALVARWRVQLRRTGHAAGARLVGDGRALGRAAVFLVGEAALLCSCTNETHSTTEIAGTHELHKRDSGCGAMPASWPALPTSAHMSKDSCLSAMTWCIRACGSATRVGRVVSTRLGLSGLQGRTVQRCERESTAAGRNGRRRKGGETAGRGRERRWQRVGGAWECPPVRAHGNSTKLAVGSQAHKMRGFGCRRTALAA